MTAQLNPPSVPLATPPETEAWQQQIVLMEKVARKALRSTKGVVSTQLWIAGTEEQPALNMNIGVKTAADLVAVVDYVTDDLIAILEYMQGRAFAENHLNFTIASTGETAPAGAAQQILTIT